MDKSVALNIINEQLVGNKSQLREALETLIPELKESKDERIRRDILETLSYGIAFEESILMPGVKTTLKEATAYLEKQKYNRMQPIYDNQESFELALDKAWRSYNESGARTVDSCEDDYIECAHAKGFREGYLFGLKGQKEQKPIKSAPIKSPSDQEIIDALLHHLNEQDGILTAIDGISTKAIMGYLEKQKEQKMFVPKFKVGDNIKYRGDIYEITDVETNNNGSFYYVSIIGTPSEPYDIRTCIGPGGEKDMEMVELPTEYSIFQDIRKKLIALVEKFGKEEDKDEMLNYLEKYQPVQSAREVKEFNFQPGDPDEKAIKRLKEMIYFACDETSEVPMDEACALDDWLDEKCKPAVHEEQKPYYTYEQSKQAAEDCYYDKGYNTEDGGRCNQQSFLWGFEEGVNWCEQYKQQPAEKQYYDGLTDLEGAIHRGFLSAGVENVPVAIIKETAQDCLAHIDKPAEWSEEDNMHLTNAILAAEKAWGTGSSTVSFLKSLRLSWKPSKDEITAMEVALKFLLKHTSDEQLRKNAISVIEHLK